MAKKITEGNGVNLEEKKSLMLMYFIQFQTYKFFSFVEKGKVEGIHVPLSQNIYFKNTSFFPSDPFF